MSSIRRGVCTVRRVRVQHMAVEKLQFILCAHQSISNVNPRIRRSGWEHQNPDKTKWRQLDNCHRTWYGHGRVLRWCSGIVCWRQCRSFVEQRALAIHFGSESPDNGILRSNRIWIPNILQWDQNYTFDGTYARASCVWSWATVIDSLRDSPNRRWYKIT